jgi:hypothetical protein
VRRGYPAAAAGARQDLALVGSERKQSRGQEGEVDSRPAQASDIRLRDVEASDIEIFYDQQLDPEATAMAAFPARDRESHLAHWNKILKDSSNITRTIVAAGQVAGNIGSWVQRRTARDRLLDREGPLGPRSRDQCLGAVPADCR